MSRGDGGEAVGRDDILMMCVLKSVLIREEMALLAPFL